MTTPPVHARRAALTAAGLLSLYQPLTAAQDSTAAAEPATAKPEVLEAVTVTAQRREQKLQDVPVAVTAFNAQQLEARGIENILDLNSLSPGLQISQTAATSTISQIFIRGIGEINPAIFWDTGVGIYLDGVYIGKSQGSVFDAVDLERVEVLRGPQGTLYGRNTIGGAINLVTRKPSGQFNGQAQVEVGNYNALVNKVSLDLPKYGIASVSLGARLEQRDGWVQTDPGSSTSELNNKKNAELRFAVNLALAPGLQADYRFDHSDIDQAGPYSQLTRFDFSPLYPGLDQYISSDRRTRTKIDAPSYEHSKVMGHSLTLSYDADAHNTLKSITAYRHMDWSAAPDLDGSPAPIVYGERLTTYHQWSQELQAVGRYDKFNYVAGLYYYSDDGYTNNPQAYFGINDIVAGAFGIPTSILPVGSTAYASQFDSQYGSKTGAGAAYFQVDYKPIDPLTLTAGYRYTREHKSIDRIYGECTLPSPIGQCAAYNYVIPAGTHAGDSFSGSTPVFSAAWAFNRNLNVYARFAEGFKSGGFNGEYSAPAASQSSADQIAELKTPFRPEKQKSYELGFKSTELGGRAQFNMAAFINKNTDLQQSIFTGSGAASTTIRNAGKSTVRGVEAEGVFVPYKGARLTVNYAWLDPKYDEFIDGGVDVSNNRVFPHTPRNAYNIVFDSKIAQLRYGQLRGVVDWSYTSSIFLYPYQIEQTNPAAATGNDVRVDGYGTLNLRLSLGQIKLGESAIGEVALWMRNALDEDKAINLIDFGPGFGNLTEANFMDPRTWGATATVRF